MTAAFTLFSLSSLSGVTDLVGARRNVVRELWDATHRLPGGRLAFSLAIGRAAPYTGSIGARVEALRRGHARVTMRDRKAVRNHLDCVHAIALANLAELTGNVALAYSLPDDARFIVAGFAIEYWKKARGTITAICDCPTPTTSDREEYCVEVAMRDEAGVEVCRAKLRSLVGPKRTRAPS
jgi:acyl-coenzyme A thioesterase PaaI-like protein